MNQRALVTRSEAALSEQPIAARPSMASDLREMLSFAALEALLLSGCRSPKSRFAVSHYLRWMSGLADCWSDEELLLELLAVLSIAAEPPRPEAPMD